MFIFCLQYAKDTSRPFFIPMDLETSEQNLAKPVTLFCFKTGSLWRQLVMGTLSVAGATRSTYATVSIVKKYLASGNFSRVLSSHDSLKVVRILLCAI